MWDNGCFLGIENSVTGRSWKPRHDNPEIARTLGLRCDLPELLARVLAGRNVDVAHVEAFLQPTLKTHMPDPATLRDGEKAAERIVQAISSDEKITIFGDYDVDGATSSALLKLFLEAIGCSCDIYIPNRLTEGYGPNKAALDDLAGSGTDLLITVDCGITSHHAISSAQQHAMDVVIIDHHLADEKLPDAVAIVNPNRRDDISGLGYLAAVGVTFLMVVLINRHLREAKWYGEGRPEPDLLKWLDLVALGTICDVVPLTGLNRAFVTQGLKVLGRRQNVGLRALADVAGLDRKPDTYAAGFILGPRINAAGRLGHSDLGAKLLSTDDDLLAADIARELHELNRQRREIEQRVLDQAFVQVEAETAGGKSPPILICCGDDWHSGVVGIVAGRIKDRFRRPAIVIGFDVQGMGTGSGRSLSGVDLGRAVKAAVDAGILEKGGGHEMAAGLTLKRERLGDLRSFLEERLTPDVEKASRNQGFMIDGAVSAGGATLELLSMLERAGPFGTGNPEPRFVLPAHRIVYASRVGEDHVRCTLAAGEGQRLNGIAFRCRGTPLDDFLLNKRNTPVHIAGKIKLNEWQGRSTVQMIIEDAAVPVMS